MMVPIVNTLAVFSTIDVGVDAALPLFISAFVWITCAFGLAVFVGLSYTRDRFSNMFPVKVRIGDRVAVQCEQVAARSTSQRLGRCQQQVAWFRRR